MRRTILVASFLASPLLVVAAPQSANGFLGVVGNWAAVDDGGPAFKVDTAGWSGTTDPGTLRAAAASLFGVVNDTLISNSTARQAFPLAVYSATNNFSGGTITTQFKLIGGATDQTAGIVFNLKPNGEYFFVRYNTAEGNIAVWRYRNGARAAVGRGPTSVQMPLNTWHELAVTIRGTQLKASVNGTALTYEYTLPEAVSGRVGLWTKRDAITVFRSYRVTP
jgi:hypothetical protein